MPSDYALPMNLPVFKTPSNNSKKQNSNLLDRNETVKIKYPDKQR